MKRVHRGRVLGACGASIVLALAAAACGGSPAVKPSGGGEPAASAAAALPRKAPDFELRDLDGKTVKLSDSTGKIRLVDFWATWCAPCREEIPGFKELHEKYRGQGLEIIAISMDEDDEKGSGRKLVKEFVEKNRVPYANLMGNDKVAEEFGGVLGLPTAFLIDKDGTIVATWVGGVPKRVFEQKVREKLGIGPA